jgi:hypothetical protein
LLKSSLVIYQNKLQQRVQDRQQPISTRLQHNAAQRRPRSPATAAAAAKSIKEHNCHLNFDLVGKKLWIISYALKIFSVTFLKYCRLGISGSAAVSSAFAV